MKDYTNNQLRQRTNQLNNNHDNNDTLFKKVPLVYWGLDLIGVVLLAAGILIISGNSYVLPPSVPNNGIMLIIVGMLLIAPLAIKTLKLAKNKHKQR